MNCPVCTKALIVLELDQVEVDHCVGCGGTWLDAGELELLLESAEVRDAHMAQLTVDTTVTEVIRKCPICDKKMEKTRGGPDGTVIIDRCVKNDGVWLDRGELERVIVMPGAGGENRIQKLLREIFRDADGVTSGD